MTYGRFRKAIRMFGPAIAGTAMQLMAIGFLTVLFYLLARGQYFPRGWPLALCDGKTACQAAAPLVRLSYLMTAVGVALTNTPIFTQTILWARHASRALLPNKPKFSAETVAVQFSIVAVASIIEELEDSPHAVVSLGQWAGGAWLGAILWPAIWSVVVAATGSLAHAFYLSAREA